MMGEIATKLASLGISCQYGAGADIVIQADFLDASWGTGQKKIEYSASTFLDETEKTMYYWEFTKETGAGISFGGFGESSFQTGKTLFRKVKSVGYGPDGKAFEYSLDIGSIVKSFKETAKQYGWKFKVVLNRQKASYPPGYQAEYQVAAPAYQEQGGWQQPLGQSQQPPMVPPVYAQQQQPQYAQQQQPQYAQQQPLQPPQQQYADPGGAFYVQGSGSTPSGKGSGAGRDKKNSFLFYLPYAILLIFTISLFIVGEVSVTGWAVGLALLLIMFFIRNIVLKKGCLTEIIFWIILLVIIVAVCLFTAGKDLLNTGDNSSNATSQSGASPVTTMASSAASSSISANSPYTITFYQTYPSPNFRYIDSEAMKVRPVFQFNLLINMAYIASSDAEKPVAYKVTNAKVTRQSRLGNPVFCTSTLSQDTSDVIKNAFINGEYLIAYTGTEGAPYIEFSVVLDQLNVTYTYPSGTTSISSDKVITDAGIKADDLRCEVSFDIEVKDKSGRIFYYPFKIELMPGDFMKDQQSIIVNVTDKYFRQR